MSHTTLDWPHHWELEIRSGSFSFKGTGGNSYTWYMVAMTTRNLVAWHYSNSILGATSETWYFVSLLFIQLSILTSVKIK